MLHVSSDGRRLENDDGSPFFYLADTAWEAVHRLDRDEIDLLMSTRGRQRFNAIQVVALAEMDGARTPNRYGHLPLRDLDPTRPDPDYFAHVDYAVRKANEHGLFMALLPTWGDKVTPMWGDGPVVFTPDNAAAYGRFLADRYAKARMIWVLGGDRPVQSDAELLVWRRMAEGIRSVVGMTQLITFHPMGGHSSSRFVHAEPWLDFNMSQSGHTTRDNPNWEMVAHDRALRPVKPTMDGEPNYEDHPIMLGVDGRWVHMGGWFDESDVRKSLYRSLVAGACGYTYGCHDVWQCYDPARVSAVNKARTPWQKAIELPGANQVGHVHTLLARLNAIGRIEPSPALLHDAPSERHRHMVAATVGDSAAVLYTPLRQALRIARPRLTFEPAGAEWFDPRTGTWQPGQFERKGLSLECAPPDNDDFVLLLRG